jgi:dTDP-4-amino-4,6-dideoxygalactose transaminase
LKLLSSNPKANWLAHKDEISAAITRVLESGWYVLGEEVAAFENEFASYVGVRHGIGVGNGTDALQVALRACGIGQGDEVITVSNTVGATAIAIELAGARPVLVDIDPNTYTMDPNQVEQVITKATKAVIPVHLYGCPADMETIADIARSHKLHIIEDCAQSHGSTYKGRRTGTWGDMAAFSFYPTKNLGAIGDGGMVVTDDSELAERARLAREYGWREKYVSESVGLNSRLDELQAAILRAKLPFLDEENGKRQVLATMYDELLSPTSLTLPKCAPNATHVYHQYVVRTPHRDALREFLARNGIGTLIHYPVPIHEQPAFRDRLRCAGSMMHTNRIVKEILSLPMYPELPPNTLREVAQTIVSWDRNQGV